ncbi:MAG: hypothetical protein INF91_01795, partial [Alphaproteobacteria bacterium]|nr:hypothetical protein [Alphaproteobacteria bacterium]
MRGLLLGGVVVLLMAGAVAGGFAAQYVTQLPLIAAIQSILASRAGQVIAADFGPTMRAQLHDGPVTQDFGPLGASRDRSYAPLCYGAAGEPLPRAEAAAGTCPQPLRLVPVFDAASLTNAMRTAQPGDYIRLAPGTYRLGGQGIYATAIGRPDAPIVVAADILGDVRIESEMGEGFAVQGAYWAFGNLEMVGVCADDNACEHAIHASGDARGLVIRNNRISDFNSQIKINGRGTPRRYPDAMLIEGNNIIDSRPRRTPYPVTKIDGVGTHDLRIIGNVIADFAKEGSDQRSYGAFAKGNSRGTRIERNLVVCEWRHSGGGRIGLSLGGGGTGEAYCRGGSCPAEDTGGIIRANIVIGCSDVGIYLREAAEARIERNLVAGTRGIDARFPSTSAALEANLIDGRVIAWNGSTITDKGNLVSPWRAVRRQPVTTDYIPFAHRGEFGALALPEAPAEPMTRDICGQMLPPTAPMGP